ncbi:MAG TPA: GDP-mannose 4,6-dehydratase [Sphingopyxis sp.]|nr:GDP-mannose 4,6-dehydratase [Sphingopyxis sp.]HMP44153.1 GDP-mannose 4,6-dehydratase [Sphingopyxis sp.]HMQ19303.1 GDP-mannose 4,6-dehydratase [Sphingopyxis sp.]
MAKSALICGISGQDGSLLARHLLSLGYRVAGTSRDGDMMRAANLERLGIRDAVSIHSMATADFRSIIQTLDRLEIDELYNLSGQSSVGLSFDQPVETMDSIAGATLTLLEAIRFLGRPMRFYNAGSSECFGDIGDTPATEETPFKPRSPYAVAKATAHWTVANYREAYGLFACTGILFNHESPLRPERFVTQKIVRGAADIAAGRRDTLLLGNLDIWRDWGWAPEYVEAMHLILQQEEPGDFIIATGRTTSLEEFVAAVFAEHGLDWRRHVVSDPALIRPADLRYSGASPQKARERLGWQARTTATDVARRMAASGAGDAGWLAGGPSPALRSVGRG